MGAGILPTVLDAAPSPKRLAITTASPDELGRPPLPSIAANISAYADGTATYPHFDVLVTASTDCSNFVFSVPSLDTIETHRRGSGRIDQSGLKRSGHLAGSHVGNSA